MTLIIDTANKDIIKLALEKNKKIIGKLDIKARQKQAERLLSGIDRLIKRNKVDIKDIKSIKVASKGDSFTSLRIGVITANTLAYALDIVVTAINDDVKKNSLHLNKKMFKPVIPIYNRQPDIKVQGNMI